MASNFRIVHEFPCTTDELWAFVEDEATDIEMGKAGNADTEWLSVERGDVISIHKRVNTRRELPAAMKKIIGGDEIGYELRTEREAGANEQTWNITPLVLAGKVTCSGTAAIESTPGGCRRIIEGRVNIAVPLLGKKMEKKLIESIVESYDGGADALRAHIAKG